MDVRRHFISIVFTLLVTVSLVVSQDTDYWRPPRLAKVYRGGEMTYIYSMDNAKYDTWYAVGERSIFTFGVRGCSEVNLALATRRSINADTTIEVVIGAESNSMVGIRYSKPLGSGDTQSWLASAPVSGGAVLHCHEYRTFWLAWGTRSVELGRGPVKGQQTLMNWYDESGIHRINNIGLRAMAGNSASWAVKENSGEYFLTRTPNYYRYQMIWKTVEKRSFANFRVKAESDVHVVLTANMGDTQKNVYEIVLGGWKNTRSVIRTNTYYEGADGKEIKARNDTNNLLDGNKQMEFWISWRNGSIEAGQGGIYGEMRLVRWQDPNPINVRYLSVSTGWDTKGTFRFEDDLETVTYVRTPDRIGANPDIRYNTSWFETPHKEFFTFGLTACENAYVFLSNIKGLDEEFGFEVFIGENQNRATGIRNIATAGDLISVPTELILDCINVKWFWISWHNGTIRVGQASLYLENQLLEYDFGRNYRVNAIGLATTKGRGLWRIRDTSGESLTLYDYGNYNSSMLPWRWMPQYKTVLFTCKACSDCHVSVAPSIGVDGDNEWYLDIIIGGWTNQRSAIKLVKGRTRPPSLVQVDTANIVDCNNHRDFWVSWIDDDIRVGRGAVPLYSEIMRTSHDLVQNIKAVSFSSYTKKTAEFTVKENNGDFFTLYTTSNYDYWQHWLAVYHHTSWVVVNIRACNDAHVMLASTWADPNPDEDDDLIEIVIGASDNNRALIRTTQLGTPVNSTQVANLLDCNNNRPFWISWLNGNIEVGKGTIYGVNPIITWKHPNPFTIEGLTVSNGWNSFGRYQILGNAGWRLTTHTPDNHVHQYNWRMVEHRQSFHFTVQACSDAHIALSERQSYLDEFAYEVVIGGWNNTQSIVRETQYNEWLAQISTPGILNCSAYMPFWITWYGGSIAVGRGRIIGQNVFLDFQETSPKFIKAISVATGYGFTGNWTIDLLDELIEPEPPFTPVPPSQGSNSSGVHGGVIAGAIIGALLLIGLVAGVVFLLFRKGILQDMKSKMENRMGASRMTNGDNSAPGAT